MEGASSSSSAAPNQERRLAAGSYIEHPQLTQLCAMLKAIDAGDRIVKGRLELFACSRRRLSRNQEEELQRVSPGSFTNSPLGPLSTLPAQNLLANLRAFLSLLFVDYDCSGVSPDDFVQCPDKHTVVTTINHSLVAVVDRVHSGFLAEFWQVVQESIDLQSCDVCQFVPVSGPFEPNENALQSFSYFFMDISRGRILFIGSVTKSREGVRVGMDSDSDVILSAADSGSSFTSKARGAGGASDMGSSLQDGEYAFSGDDSGSEGMLD